MLCIIFAWKVRNVKEGYHIRTEFVLIAVGVIYIVAVLIPRERDRTNLVWLTLLWMGFNYALSATCVYPVAKPYGFEWRNFRRFVMCAACVCTVSSRCVTVVASGDFGVARIVTVLIRHERDRGRTNLV